MKTKWLIGGAVLLALGVAAVLGLSKLGNSGGGQLVGSLGIQQIEVQPESPSADDSVSLRLVVALIGRGNTRSGGLPLHATVELKGEPQQPPIKADLSLPDGLGVAGVTRWGTTVLLGKLSEGEQTFVVTIPRPAHGLVGDIAPPRELRVVVKPGTNP